MQQSRVYLVSSSGPVTVRTTLYGDVDRERLDREKLIIKRRAEMLNTVIPPVKRPPLQVDEFGKWWVD